MLTIFLCGYVSAILTGGLSITLYCMWREYGRRRYRPKKTKQPQIIGYK